MPIVSKLAATGGRYGRSGQRSGLPDQVCHESTGEARDKHPRGYQDDQVNAPRVVASAHKIDMGGAVFVSICVKAHGGSLHLRSAVPSEKIPNGPRRGPPLAHTEYHVPRPPGARISGQAGISGSRARRAQTLLLAPGPLCCQPVPVVAGSFAHRSSKKRPCCGLEAGLRSCQTSARPRPQLCGFWFAHPQCRGEQAQKKFPGFGATSPPAFGPAG